MKKDYNKQKWGKSNPDWWYDAIEEEPIDEGVDGFSYYGSGDKRYVEFSVEPLNSGNAIKLTLLFDKDLDGDIDDGFLTVSEKSGCREPLKEKKIYRLGDIGIDPLVMIAVSILKVFEPRLAPTNKNLIKWSMRYKKESL